MLRLHCVTVKHIALIWQPSKDAQDKPVWKGRISLTSLCVSLHLDIRGLLVVAYINSQGELQLRISWQQLVCRHGSKNLM